MMTTADATAHGSPTPDPESTRSGPSVHVVRARKLLFGGLVGGGSAAVLSVLGFGLGYGGRGAGHCVDRRGHGAVLLRCRAG